MPEVQTIVMKVGMHCDGCAKKVRKILTRMAGVEELKVDYTEQKVTVKGALDPDKVAQRVSKAGKAVEILEIIAEPPKPSAEDAAGTEPPKEPPPPQVQTITLRIMMHCEGCARKVKDVLKKIPGVQEVDVDFKEQKVIVKGNMDTNMVLRKASKTGKQVELWPIPPEEPKEAPKEVQVEEKKDSPPEENKDGPKTEEAQAPKEEKKNETKEETKDAHRGNVVSEDQKKEESKEDAKEETKDTPKEQDKQEEKIDGSEEKIEAKGDEKDVPKQEKKEESKDESKFFFEEVMSSPYIVYRYDAPQMFSDDNPNACTIM